MKNTVPNVGNCKNWLMLNRNCMAIWVCSWIRIVLIRVMWVGLGGMKKIRLECFFGDIIYVYTFYLYLCCRQVYEHKLMFFGLVLFPAIDLTVYKVTVKEFDRSLYSPIPPNFSSLREAMLKEHQQNIISLLNGIQNMNIL